MYLGKVLTAILLVHVKPVMLVQVQPVAFEILYLINRIVAQQGEQKPIKCILERY